MFAFSRVLCAFCILSFTYYGILHFSPQILPLIPSNSDSALLLNQTPSSDHRILTVLQDLSMPPVFTVRKSLTWVSLTKDLIVAPFMLSKVPTVAINFTPGGSLERLMKDSRAISETDNTAGLRIPTVIHRRSYPESSSITTAIEHETNVSSACQNITPSLNSSRIEFEQDNSHYDIITSFLEAQEIREMILICIIILVSCGFGRLEKN